MKTLRALLMVFACALMFTYNASGQVIKQDIVVTIDQLDYEPWCPGIGVVTGSYTYQMTLKLTKEGYLDKLLWHVKDANLTNDKGDKVIIVDSGHDNLGILWDWFNNANYYNLVVYNGPEIVYTRGDGSLDGYMPPVMPTEGVAVDMSCKLLCKGVIYKMPLLAVVQINANGDMVVNFIKP